MDWKAFVIVFRFPPHRCGFSGRYLVRGSVVWCGVEVRDSGAEGDHMAPAGPGGEGRVRIRCRYAVRIDNFAIYAVLKTDTYF